MDADCYHVLLTPLADRKLAAHIEFLARVSEQAAARLYMAYEESLIFLKHSPRSCPVYTPKTPTDAELRYKLFYSRYRIVFEIIGDMVYGYDIQDCRQDMAHNLI